ncbi:hypothetical protein J6590_073112 [Homalodisca vitripennis]|nr:hypothetical protein J6590_073112 [Homalodisca vitripennis]
MGHRTAAQIDSGQDQTPFYKPPLRLHVSQSLRPLTLVRATAATAGCVMWSYTCTIVRTVAILYDYRE